MAHAGRLGQNYLILFIFLLVMPKYEGGDFIFLYPRSGLKAMSVEERERERE